MALVIQRRHTNERTELVERESGETGLSMPKELSATTTRWRAEIDGEGAAVAESARSAAVIDR